MKHFVSGQLMFRPCPFTSTIAEGKLIYARRIVLFSEDIDGLRIVQILTKNVYRP